jgi:hypothetical protein
MDKEIDKVVIKDEDLGEINEYSEDDLADDEADWKAKAQENLGIAKRRTSQLGKAKTYISKLEKLVEGIKKEPEPQDKKIDNSQPSKFDFGELVFYNNKDGVVKVMHDDDIEFLKQEMTENGKAQSYVLNSKYFQEELKKRQEARVAQNAIPAGSKRTAPAASDSLDYHYRKYEESGFTKLPEDTVMRRKVINERSAREKGSNSFFG